MEKDIRDFLVPILGPLNAFYKANKESKINLERALSGKMQSREFKKTELINTAYVLSSGAASTVLLYYAIYSSLN